MKNYYEILEVNQKASQEIIEKAYKVLIEMYHPDLYSGEMKEQATYKIKEITEAYKILSDEFLREQYDAELEREFQEEQLNKYKKLYGQEINNKNNENTQREESRRAFRNKAQKKEASAEKEEKTEKSRVGTFLGIVDVVKELLKNKPKADFNKITSKDLLAVGLTILVVASIGLILWFLPFTNQWMREFLFLA